MSTATVNIYPGYSQDTARVRFARQHMIVARVHRCTHMIYGDLNNNTQGTQFMNITQHTSTNAYTPYSTHTNPPQARRPQATYPGQGTRSLTSAHTNTFAVPCARIDAAEAHAQQNGDTWHRTPHRLRAAHRALCRASG